MLLVVVFSLCTWLSIEYDRVSSQYGMDNFSYKTSKKGAIYSNDGVLLTYIYQLNKEHVPLEKIAQPMQEAIVAIEDHRFYDHFGVDLRGTIRALYRDITYGGLIEGGSTITQQLVRNLFLSSEKTLTRKVTEILLAINMERRFTKEEILEMYLNEVYFGNGCYGVETASQKYFGKSASALNLAESTMLAAIPKAPNYYDPLNHLNKNKSRQRNTMDRMVSLCYITPDDAQQALRQNVTVMNYSLNKQQPPYKYPYFTTEVIRQLIHLYGKERVYNGGLKVITTLDSRASNIAEQIAKRKAEQYKSLGITATNLALASVRITDGAVIAMVGGADYTKDQNNLAAIPRQPGSAIKPINYAGALEQGSINENSIFNASSKSFGKYFVGSNINANVSVCSALKYSMNVPAVEVLNRYGVNNALENLKRFGITTTSDKDANLALALGGMYHGIMPVEIAAAYATFANYGQFNKYYMIKSVQDHTGKMIFQHKNDNKQIISRKTAQVITQVLLEVVNGGTGTRANISGNEAGKTGTTNDSRCLWFVGYNKDVATAVWIGNTNNTPVHGFNGGDLAAPIWREYTLTLIKQYIISKPSKIYDSTIPLKQTYIAHKIEEPEKKKEEQQKQPEQAIVKGKMAKDSNTEAQSPNIHELKPKQSKPETTILPKEDNKSQSE